MLFNSLEYIVFLPIVFFLYWLIPHRFRWILLLAASYYFYMSWKPRYIVLILFTTAVSYSAARLIEKHRDDRRRCKCILVVAVLLSLMTLFIFKYLNFMLVTLDAVLGLFTIQIHPTLLTLMLPVGISFYTFQTLSYVVDVYRGDISAERHFGLYATFISFFPQLVAGPIERASNLLPQLKTKKAFDEGLATEGAKQMLWGYYKKLVIADNLSVYVDMVYANLHSYTGCDLCIVILFFSLQIYCDFSGYSDIAIGTAKLLGIRLMTNFEAPYFSASLKEFWSRWHISLSRWFRDYVYIPLGGNRCSKGRRNLNLLTTFLLSGLWHGANWTFIAWGGVHGLGQVLENAAKKPLDRVHNHRMGKGLCTIVVFVFCNLAWVLFRANSIRDAYYVFSHMLDGVLEGVFFQMETVIGKLDFAILSINILLLTIYDYCHHQNRILFKKKTCQWVMYVILGCLIVTFSKKGLPDTFVYFQF